MLSEHDDGVETAAYSPDGAHIVTASDDSTARIWDARTGRELAVLTGHGDRVNRAAYSPDGTHIVTASDDKTARIWDARTGRELKVLWDTAIAYTRPPTPLTARVSSPPRSTRPPASGMRAPARMLAVVARHSEFVISAAYSPDGTRIVTASDDKTARIWDARTTSAARGAHGTWRSR